MEKFFVDLDDVPVKPKSVSFENQRAFLDGARSRTNDVIQDRLASLRHRGNNMSKEQIQAHNEEMRNTLKKEFHSIQQQLISIVEVKQSDTAEEVKFKIDTGGSLVQWIRGLGEWLIEKLQSIFQKTAGAFDWCVQKAKEVLEKLWSLFE